METVNSRQPWLRSAMVDLIFILSPPFFALFIVMMFPAGFKNSAAMPLAYWVVLIVMIDVAHVYTTLYRTYFNPVEFRKNQPLLIAIPLFCYIVGVILHIFDGMLFWRVLAYLAVFHFIRQQYGFMRIYSRGQFQSKSAGLTDTAAIYMATIYPLLYWHLSSKRNYNWFVDGDFVYLHSGNYLWVCSIVYYLVIAVYLVKEITFSLRHKKLNVPKNLVMAGTFLSWYFGIVYYNGDMAFTTLNVVSHGIPYMALIWFTEQKRFNAQNGTANALLKLTFSRYGVLCFAGLIILLAYLEEGLWDGLVWKEHPSVFKLFSGLPAVTQTSLLALLVPLLALPQSTHYVLDGFIWRFKKHKESL